MVGVTFALLFNCWNENEFLDDYDLWLRLSKEKKSFFNISELLVLHRIHNTSAFNNTNDNYVNNLKFWRIKWFKI